MLLKEYIQLGDLKAVKKVVNKHKVGYGIYLACSYGKLDILKYLVSIDNSFLYFKRSYRMCFRSIKDLFKIACIKQHVDIAEYLYSKSINKDMEYIWKCVFESKSLDILAWMFYVNQDSMYRTIDKLYSYGTLEMFEYLIYRNAIHAGMGNYDHYLYSNRDVRVIKWIHSHWGFTSFNIKDCLDTALETNNIRLLKWMIKYYTETEELILKCWEINQSSRPIMYDLFYTNKLEMIKYLIKYSTHYVTDSIKYLMLPDMNYHLDILEWIHNLYPESISMILKDPQVIRNIIYHKKLDILKWLDSKGFIKNMDCWFSDAISTRNLPIIKFVYNNINKDINIHTFLEDLMSILPRTRSKKISRFIESLDICIIDDLYKCGGHGYLRDYKEISELKADINNNIVSHGNKIKFRPGNMGAKIVEIHFKMKSNTLNLQQIFDTYPEIMVYLGISFPEDIPSKIESYLE